MVEEDSKIYTIQQAAKVLGVPAYTLRRLCNSSLLPGWRHSIGTRRTFTAEQVERLRTILLLQRAGITLSDIRKYLRWVEEADGEKREFCRKILATHKRQVWRQVEELQKTIDFLERQEDMLVEEVNEGASE